MTDVKSKRLAGGEPFETAERLHSAAIHLLRRLRCATAKAALARRSYRVISFGLRWPEVLGELADAEQVRPPTMSRIVAGLESAGLVRRHATGRRAASTSRSERQGTKILQEGTQAAGGIAGESSLVIIRGRAAENWERLRPAPAGRSESLEIF